MMSVQLSKLLCAGLLFACSSTDRPNVARAEGRLEVAVHSGSAEGSPAAGGTLLLRSLERPETRQVAFEGAEPNASVSLTPGAYLVEWQPNLAFSSSEAVGWGGVPLLSDGPRVVVVFADTLAKLNVNVSVPAAELRLASAR